MRLCQDNRWGAFSALARGLGARERLSARSMDMVHEGLALSCLQSKGLSELHSHFHCRPDIPFGGDGHLGYPVANREPGKLPPAPYSISQRLPQLRKQLHIHPDAQTRSLGGISIHFVPPHQVIHQRAPPAPHLERPELSSVTTQPPLGHPFAPITLSHGDSDTAVELHSSAYPSISSQASESKTLRVANRPTQLGATLLSTAIPPPPPYSGHMNSQT